MNTRVVSLTLTKGLMSHSHHCVKPSMVAGAVGPTGQSVVTAAVRARGPGPGHVTPRPPLMAGPRVSGTLYRAASA